MSERIEIPKLAEVFYLRKDGVWETLKIVTVMRDEDGNYRVQIEIPQVTMG